MFRRASNLGLMAMIALFPCQDKLWSYLNYFHWLWGGTK